MLDVNPDTVCFLIDRARVFHAKEQVVIDDEPNSPADDWGRQVLADHKGDATYQEFISTFNNLEPDQQQEVVALMWIGRGDYDESEWESVVDDAKNEWTDNTATYLLAHPLLAAYLSEGLELLGYSCTD